MDGCEAEVDIKAED